MKVFPISITVYNKNIQNINSSQKNNIGIIAGNRLLINDEISFTSTKSDKKMLRKLAEYGLTDMYTGKPMIPGSQLEKMLNNSTFDLPLIRLVPILEKFKDTMTPVTTDLLNKMKKISKKHPDIKLDKFLQLLYEDSQKQLLRTQQSIFGELMQKACEMPHKQYKDFITLMQETNKRIAKAPVILPFSSKELIYKLERAAIEIKSKNNQAEIRTVNNLIYKTKQLFKVTKHQKSMFGRNKMTKQKKLAHQMQPEILKQNIQNLNYLKMMLNNSPLKNNKEINNIFDSTSGKIYGFPIVSPFRRKEFIYDMQKITSTLKNKELSAEMTKIAHKLPTSVDNSAAFIVKYINDTPEKIGYYLMLPNICSIEHIKPEINGGKNRLFNYGLCSKYINAKRSNIPFKEWLAKYPESYKNIHKYYNKLIVLYKNGVFDKIGLNKSYITDFANTVYEESGKDQRLRFSTELLN